MSLIEQLERERRMMDAARQYHKDACQEEKRCHDNVMLALSNFMKAFGRAEAVQRKMTEENAKLDYK